jgi:L-methionine (R)-S-oxide reductase
MSVAALADDDLLAELRALLAGEPDPIANAANISALIFNRLPQLNWVGFYFLRGDVLVLGPFQGQPACTRIKLGQGVCGTAAERNETILVPDVHAFEGHIVCDTASLSEIVVPFSVAGQFSGVLDVDSPVLNRFGVAEQSLLEAVAALYVEACEAITIQN